MINLRLWSTDSIHREIVENLWNRCDKIREDCEQIKYIFSIFLVAKSKKSFCRFYFLSNRGKSLLLKIVSI